MTVRNPIVGVQSLGNVLDALTARRDLGTLAWAADSTGKVQSGVVPGWGSEFPVTVNSTTLQVTVGTGAAILGAPTAGDGCWPLVNDASITLTLNARDASNPRIDLVIARVADPYYYAGGDGQAAIEVVTGSPAASPTAPAVPTAKGSCIVLAQLTVPSSSNNGAVTNSSAAFVNVPRAAFAGLGVRTYTPTLKQTNTISLTSGKNSVKYQVLGNLITATGSIATAVTHSGGGGRPVITLPVPHAMPLDNITMLGTWYLHTSSSTIGDFSGDLCTYVNVGASWALLRQWNAGPLTDSYNFDIPANSILSYTLNYFAA